MKLEIMNVNVCVSHMHAPPPHFFILLRGSVLRTRESRRIPTITSYTLKTTNSRGDPNGQY